MGLKYDGYEVFQDDETTDKFLIDKDFYTRFFIENSSKLEKTLTASSLKVGAYLLTVLGTNEYKRLPQRKDIGEATDISTKSVIDALNLLVSAKFLIRRDPGMYVNSKESLNESRVWPKKTNKNLPKYFDDFKINSLYNLHSMDEYRQFENRKTNQQLLELMRKNQKFNNVVNYCLNNPSIINVLSDTVKKDVLKDIEE